MLDVIAPAWLAAGVLLVIPLYRNRTRAATAPALRHPFASLLDSNPQRKRHEPQRWWYVSIFCTLLALAQPQWLSDWVAQPQQQRDIMIALDVSASMRAEDFVWDGQVVNRLTATKNLLAQLFAARRGDRFGLHVFGEDSFALTPPTADTVLLNSLLAEIQPGLAGEKTALGDALAASIQRLAAQPVKAQKVLIVFSDGTRTAGRLHPLRTLTAARTAGVRIHTVGIGRDAPVPFPGAVTEAPKLVRLPLDEATLRQLANETGGRYFRVQSAPDLHGLIEQLADLEPLRTVQHARRHTPLFWIPLSGALIAGLLGYWSVYWRVTPAPLR